jgi:hypothetical protein
VGALATPVEPTVPEGAVGAATVVAVAEGQA